MDGEQEERVPVALALSQKCVALMLERGTTAIPAAELARAAGVSPSNFHRYLGSSEASVRPVLRAGIDLVADALRERPAGEALGQAVVQAFAAAAGGPLFESTLRLIPLLAESPASRAVWGRSIRDGEYALAGPIAERMGAPAGSPRAVVIATIATSLIRRALEEAVRQDADPVDIFRRSMGALTGGPLAPAVIAV